MAKTSSGVYRCPSCGGLTQVDFEAEGKNSCSECGFTFRRPVRVAPRASGARLPSGGKFVQRDVVSRRRITDNERIVTPAVPTDIDVIKPEEDDPSTEILMDDGHKRVVRRRKKRRKPRIAPLLFLCAWFAAAMLVVLFVKNRIERAAAPVVNEEELEERRRTQVQKAQIEDYLRREIPETRLVLNRFFGAGDSAGRAQAVRDPVRVTPKMVTYYQSNPPRRPSGVLKPLVQNLYIDGEKRAIETVWRDPDGKELEAVFIRQEGQWRIDWEAFVRSGSAEWLLFVNGTPRTGEFRVYMRRLESIQQGGTEPTIGLKFYPPSYDPRLRNRGESETALVSLESDLGQRLQDVFAARQRTPGVGESKLGHRDPDGLYRVRVRLAWKEAQSGKPFLHLEELIAPNWYGEGFEEVGLAPPEALEESGEEPSPGSPGPDEGEGPPGQPDAGESETPALPDDPSAGNEDPPAS